MFFSWVLRYVSQQNQTSIITKHKKQQNPRSDLAPVYGTRSPSRSVRLNLCTHFLFRPRRRRTSYQIQKLLWHICLFFLFFACSFSTASSLHVKEGNTPFVSLPDFSNVHANTERKEKNHQWNAWNLVFKSWIVRLDDAWLVISGLHVATVFFLIQTFRIWWISDKRLVFVQ